MHGILEVLISNGLVASGLALPAVIATGLRARPALVHCLWVLVLLKLVTPPIVRVPIKLPVSPSQSATLLPYGPPPASSLDLSQLLPAGRAPAALRELPATRPETSTLPWTAILLGLWPLGSGLVLVSTWRGVGRMRSLVRGSRPSPRLQRRVDELAPRLGLARPPRVFLVPGKLSPMLWAAGGQPALLIPEQLLPRLDQHEQTTLLAHELAHLRRRDHWVRYLEVLVRGIYWWNPLVWWACRQLRVAEEECCDAWVLWALPRASRSYADALLQTVEFLSDSPAVLPVAASGVGRVQNLKRRLTMIMQAKTRRNLSSAGRGLVLGLAALALPLLPVHGQGTGELHGKEALHEQHLHLKQLHEHLTQLHQKMADLKLHAEHLHQQGDLHAVEQVKHEIASLHDTIEVESQDVADLQLHLQMQDRAREQGPHAHNPKEILAALHEAIDALRDRDQDEEARVLSNLAEEIMSNVERESPNTDVDESRLLVAELQMKLADEQHRRKLLEEGFDPGNTQHTIEVDRAAQERHLIEMDKRAAEQRHLIEVDKILAEELLAKKRKQAAEMDRRKADETLALTERLFSDVMRGDQQTDRIRQLEDRIDELADMVKQLTEMTKKQQAELDRRRIR